MACLCFFENAVVCVCCVSPLFSNDIVCVCDVSVLRNYTYVRHYSVSALEKRTVVGVCACDVSFMCLRFRKYLISSFLDKTYGSWKWEYIQFWVENMRPERKLYGPWKLYVGHQNEKIHGPFRWKSTVLIQDSWNYFNQFGNDHTSFENSLTLGRHLNSSMVTFKYWDFQSI